MEESGRRNGRKGWEMRMEEGRGGDAGRGRERRGANLGRRRSKRGEIIDGGRVLDPHWFNADPDTDPDPAFFLIADPVPGSGSKVWWSKIGKKLTTRNLIFIFLIKNCNLPIPRPWTPKLQEKPSALKREHPALQKMKILFFFGVLGHFCPPGSGSGSNSSN